MAVFKINVNGQAHSVEAEPDMPVLWVLRDLLGLTGTKYGCGIGECGACAILVDGEDARGCQTPISDIGNKKITTIEGLAKNGLHPLQKAWIEHDVPQCGYCQTGHIMSAAALLQKTPNPTDAQIDEALGSHICRCGTYTRIKEAVKIAAKGGVK
ncbi:MAG TPA: (2Fe-2S)-binding protein [Fimbriimonadaceae bacterium]|nr:(2Fe-2S)-binding protein [Fimbriimonadaceae bacterium]